MVKVDRSFDLGGKSSPSFNNNIRIVQEAGEKKIEAGSMIALMEIARNLDRIANALEKRE